MQKGGEAIMSVVVEAIFSGFVSKAVNDTVDFSGNKIKKAIEDRNNQNFSTRIYRVIENVLNVATYNKYKKTDILYDAVESVFRSFKRSGNNLEAVRSGLSMLITNVSDDLCEYFIDQFYDEICKDDYLCKKVNLILQERGINYNKEEFHELNKKIENNHAELSNKMDVMAETLYGNMPVKHIEDEKFHNNKKQDYIKIWNSRLFLHTDNDERPITLADAFIMPDYIKYKENKNIGFSNDDTLDKVIEKFVNFDKKSTMLITGVPGIGKSTIISWIAEKYKNNDKVLILRFRDWESEELEKGLLKTICNALGCKNKDLEHKILVLDGFDEMKSLYLRNKLLNSFFNDINDYKKIKCIITSRPAYINSGLFNNSIELRPFNNKQIRMFYEIITNNQLNGFIDSNNTDVFGIPVILYMAIMSDIDIAKKTTKPELYSRIFAEKEGIFDRFSYKGVAYSEGAHLFRNYDNIEKYLQFLQEVAFAIFEKNDLPLSKEECEIPVLEFQGKAISVLEFPIKHLFEDIENNIEFIHKSIYEFFVSEYIFSSIDKMHSTSIEELAAILGNILKKNELSEEILEFFRFRIRNSKLIEKFDIINKSFQLMLQDGMTYYTNEHYKNVIECEMKVFINMLGILHLWEKDVQKYKNIISYVQHNAKYCLNLSKIDFMNGNLSGLNLSNSNLSHSILLGADLSNANLSDVDFSYTNLRKANLSYSNLRNANFIGAEIEGINLKGAIIENAIFSDNHIGYLEKNIICEE